MFSISYYTSSLRKLYLSKNDLLDTREKLLSDGNGRPHCTLETLSFAQPVHKLARKSIIRSMSFNSFVVLKSFSSTLWNKHRLDLD